MKQLSSLVVLLSSASSSDKKRPVTKISFSMGNLLLLKGVFWFSPCLCSVQEGLSRSTRTVVLLCRASIVCSS